MSQNYRGIQDATQVVRRICAEKGVDPAGVLGELLHFFQWGHSLHVGRAASKISVKQGDTTVVARQPVTHAHTVLEALKASPDTPDSLLAHLTGIAQKQVKIHSDAARQAKGDEMQRRERMAREWEALVLVLKELANQRDLVASN